jgi:hypothetical protein
MRLSRLLSENSPGATNIEESNSINYFYFCASIWKIRIFEWTPAFRNSGKKKAPQIKNYGR